MRKTYEDFKNTYVEPTFADFLRDKFLVFPSMSDAHAWSTWRLGDGPMNEAAVASFQAAVDPEGRFPEDVHRMMRLRARTTFGWYLSAWVRYFKNWRTSFAEYQALREEDAYNGFMYAHDEFY